MTSPSRPFPDSWTGPVALSCRHRRLDEGAQVRRALADFAAAHGASGWLCTASWAGAYDPSRLVSSPANGLPLSAELHGQGASLHLRQVGGGWRLTEWRQGPLFEGEGTPEEWPETWVETVEHLAVPGHGVPSGTTLRYDRHHAPVLEGPSTGDPIPVWRPLVAVFRGLAGGAS